MPTVKPSDKGRRRTKRKPLPVRFVSESLKNCDQRFAIVRRLKRELKELVEATGADTPQKLAICEEVVWTRHRLTVMKERMIAGDESIADSVYVQQSNCLVRSLQLLGLDKVEASKAAAGSLSEYLEQDGDG